MTDFNIPVGKAIPLIDEVTKLLPAPTMDALDDRYVAGLNGATGIWIGTEAELPPEPRDPTIVYFVV